jgi:hypothetical protein
LSIWFRVALICSVDLHQRQLQPGRDHGGEEGRPEGDLPGGWFRERRMDPVVGPGPVFEAYMLIYGFARSTSTRTARRPKLCCRKSSV